MSERKRHEATGAVAAVQGHVAGPWELYLERVRRFEVHLNGARFEMLRGPLLAEGFGLRLFRPAGAKLGVGFASATDDSAESVAAAVRRAEETSVLAPSPATSVDLPTGDIGAAPSDGICDPRLWEDPIESIEAYAEALLEGVDRRGDVVASFGSVRASLIESAVVNSAGLNVDFQHTRVEVEFAVKAFGGPEGRPPGEYWINRAGRSIPTEGVGAEVRSWCQKARDVRLARPPPPEVPRVLFPPDVLADVLPSIVGFRFGGPAAVRKMGATLDTEVASPLVSIADDPHIPWADGSAPYDDEGTPTSRTALIEAGRARALLVDRIHAAALGRPPTGHGFRPGYMGSWFSFASGPGTSASTLDVAPGAGGTDAELIEAAGEGLWLDQLGYAFPDGTTSAFGGEVRLGYRIRQGKLAEPVRGGTVGGVAFGPSETPPLLSAVRAIGSRPVLSGRLRTATFVVEKFPVASA